MTEQTSPRLYGIVYKAIVINPEHLCFGKLYVGVTTKPLHVRVTQHVTGKGFMRTYNLRRSDLSWETLAFTKNREELLEQEQHHIAVLHTLAPFGLNRTIGGQVNNPKLLAKTATDHLCKIDPVDANGHRIWKGRCNKAGPCFKLTESHESKEKLIYVRRYLIEQQGNDLKGKVVLSTCGVYNCVSEEHSRIESKSAHMSKVGKLQKGRTSVWKGRKRSEESVERMRIAQRNKKWRPDDVWKSKQSASSTLTLEEHLTRIGDETPDGHRIWRGYSANGSPAFRLSNGYQQPTTFIYVRRFLLETALKKSLGMDEYSISTCGVAGCVSLKHISVKKRLTRLSKEKKPRPKGVKRSPEARERMRLAQRSKAWKPDEAYRKKLSLALSKPVDVQLARVRSEDLQGHRIWPGYMCNGQPAFQHGKLHYVRRLMFETHLGRPLRLSERVKKLCGELRCVSPDHAKLVVNIMRSDD